MSVINRMLQELEERHEDGVQKRLPGIVRAVPAPLPHGVRRPWLALIIGLFLLLGVLAWQVLATWPKKSPPTPILAITPPLIATTEPQLIPSDRIQPAPDLLVEAAPSAAGEPAPIVPLAKSVESKVAAHKSPPSDEAKPLVRTQANTPTPSKAVSEPVNTAAFKQVSKEQGSENRYREAVTLIAQGRLAEAQTALEEILRLDPRNLSARQVLLGVHVDAKRYGLAEQLLQEGLQLNIAPATQAMALARVQVERGDQVAALATLEKYAPYAVNSGEYHGFHAALLQRVGRHAEAVSQFQSALKTHPNQATWLMGAGISLQAEKRYAEAEQAYSRARASNALTPELQAFVDQRLRQLQTLR